MTNDRIRNHRTWIGCIGLALALSVFVACPAQDDVSKPIRVGMIGLDTSHVIAFTKTINAAKSGYFAGIRVVAGFPGGTDIPSSRDRVGKFTEQLRGMGIEICDSIPALLEKVDAVLLESVDGRPHLEQVRPVFEAGKRVFIDKPLAGSLVDAVLIAELGKKHGVPWFSSSSLRFAPKTIACRRGDEEVGTVNGCAAWGPCSLEPSHPDLFWYGVHGVETLFTIMGTGCETVTRVSSKDFELVTGLWDDGRIGTFRGIRRGASGYGALVYDSKKIVRASDYAGYKPLLVEVTRFFKTGVVPVEPEETLEMFAFMEAADESKRRGGAPVRVAEVLVKAKLEARERLKELLKKTEKKKN